MASSEGLWDAFSMAKGELLGNVKAVLDEGVGCHLLQHDPGTRTAADDSIHSMLSTLHMILSDLQRVKVEVLQTERLILRSIGRVQRLRSPIGILPTELIHYILIHHLNPQPQNQQEIIRVSSVCSLWQEIMHNQHALFSTADWITWPQSMSETWISRTKGGPLTILLDNTVEKVDPHSLPLLLREPRLSSFSTAARNCTSLSITDYPSSTRYLNSAFSEELAFPRLEIFRVHVKVGVETRRSVFTLAAPNLKELVVTDAGVLLSCPSPHLWIFQLSFSSHAISIVVLEASRQILQENQVRILRLHGTFILDRLSPGAEDHLFFHNLQSLEITDYNELGHTDWIRAIVRDRLKFPVVSEFRLLLRRGLHFLEEDIQTLVSLRIFCYFRVHSENQSLLALPRSMRSLSFPVSPSLKAVKTGIIVSSPAFQRHPSCSHS